MLPSVKLILTAMLIRKQHLRPRAVVGYGVKIFGPCHLITSPDHLEGFTYLLNQTNLKVNQIDHELDTGAVLRYVDLHSCFDFMS